ncbi:hypothetical protein CRM22_008847 [Opisthorchis felineus]|uniref:Homeobox domain-containing protein n=1 Tax=Opisthorchis felineus TaxID=147828 RepID=A0A4S2LA12_OPIFE|nr:hypothetical protein CRM22_008847 [Opisthorchis felineus]
MSESIFCKLFGSQTGQNSSSTAFSGLNVSITKSYLYLNVEGIFCFFLSIDVCVRGSLVSLLLTSALFWFVLSVCQLLEQNGCSIKAPTSTPPTSATSAEDLILSGHNLSALARFVHRLRQYRLRAGLSQSELSAELARHFNNETMFSQSLLSRFERLEVNVRAAFRLLPYLEGWLSHTEQKGCSMMSSESIKPDITSGKRVSGRTRTTQLIRLGSISNDLACSSDQHPNSPVESPITGALPHAIAMFSQSSEKGFGSTSTDIVPTSTCQLKNPECRTKRRKRTHFSDSVLTILSQTYKEDPRPEGAKLTRLAMETGYDREAIRVWFCNRRQVSARTDKVST